MPYTPPGSCIGWYVASKETAYGNGNAVTTATDQSPAGNNATQTSAIAPTYATNEINGLAAYLFNGSNQWLNFPSVVLTDCTFIFVLNTTGDCGLLGQTAGASPQIRYGQSGANVLSTYDGGNNPESSALGVSQGNWCILEYNCASNTVTFYQASGGGSPSSYGTGTFTGAKTFNTIGDLAGLGNTLPTAGYIAELMICDAALGSTDRAAYYSYANGKYFVPPGIQFDAASNSGYQSAASSLSWSHTWSGTNRFLAIDIAMLSVTDTVTAMTYGGANCTFIGAQNVVGGTGRIECWRICQNDSGAPSTGANTISVTLSGSLACAGAAVSYTTVSQTTPTEAFAGNSGINTGSATNATVVITTTVANDWVHAALATNQSSGIGSSQTSRNIVAGTLGTGADADTGPNASPGAQTMTFTGEGITSAWAVAGYGIVPFGSAPATAPVGKIVFVTQTVQSATF